jgi:predicted MPP superfamily phosphohydrolase
MTEIPNSQALTPAEIEQPPEQRGVRLAILGDLHYKEEEQETFAKAREQILSYNPDAIASLGDLGSHAHSGSFLSFQTARDYFKSFKKPYYPLMGNHDLEGKEYTTDEDAVAGWCDAFDLENPYYAVDLQHTILIFLSDTGNRSNLGSNHEVYLDETQIQWFRDIVESKKDTPIYIFSHCPIMGSGLRILQDLHLRIPNAWINHSHRPERFIDIVQKNPQIKLWFSGHNHLGQDYPDSISRIGSCAFVHTGVIGSASRDGKHHSRFLEFGDRGCVLSTVDHDAGTCNVDVLYEFESGIWESYTELDDKEPNTFFPPPPYPGDLSEADTWELNQSVLTLHKNMLLEYDKATKAPVGVVTDSMNDKSVQIVQDQLTLISPNGKEKVIPRSKDGRYRKIHMKNSFL